MVLNWIRKARFTKSLESQLARITFTAGSPIRQRVVATVSQPIINAQRHSLLDDLSLGQTNQWRVNIEMLTFEGLLLAFLLQLIAGRVEGDWQTVVEYLTPMSHITRGLQGRVFLSDLVYFFSTTLTALFFTLRVVESHRWR